MSGMAVNHDYERANPASSAKLLVLSVVLWIVGVATIRLVAPCGRCAPRVGAGLFLATVPVAGATGDVAKRVAGGRVPLLQATTVASVPALLLDGLALGWAPAIYGPAAMPLQAPAAWLLWFVGVSLAVALWRQMRHIAATG